MLTVINRTAALVAFSLLAGCATPAPTVRYIPTSEPFCAAVQTVCISKDDVLTEPTAQSIEANNLGRDKVCKRRQEPRTRCAS